MIKTTPSPSVNAAPVQGDCQAESPHGGNADRSPYHTHECKLCIK